MVIKPAELYRSDLPYPDKYHAFSIPILSYLHDGKTHSIYAYALNSGGWPLSLDEYQLLSGSPKSITCAPPTPRPRSMPWLPLLLLDK